MVSVIQTRHKYRPDDSHNSYCPCLVRKERTICRWEPLSTAKLLYALNFLRNRSRKVLHVFLVSCCLANSSMFHAAIHPRLEDRTRQPVTCTLSARSIDPRSRQISTELKAMYSTHHAIVQTIATAKVLNILRPSFTILFNGPNMKHAFDT
jgi:hypothetical protein